MAEIIDQNIGTATAYGYAKKKGYDGTEDQFAQDMANVGTNIHEITEAINTFNDVTVPAATSAVNSAGETQVASVNSAGLAQVAAVNSAGASQTSSINSLGTVVLNGIQAEGLAQVSAVSSAGAVQVAAVNSVGATQVEAVNSAGSTQVAAVNSAGATQVAAVNSKGQEVIASIPADYSELTQEVSDLNQALDNFENDIKKHYGEDLNAIPVTNLKEVREATVNQIDLSETSLGIINSNGTITDSEDYYVTGFIAVKPSTAYRRNTSYQRIISFDANKNAIAYTSNGVVSITTGEQTKYLRFSFAAQDRSTVMLVEGNTIPDSYIPFNSKIPEVNLELDNCIKKDDTNVIITDQLSEQFKLPINKNDSIILYNMINKQECTDGATITLKETPYIPVLYGQSYICSAVSGKVFGYSDDQGSDSTQITFTNGKRDFTISNPNIKYVKFSFPAVDIDTIQMNCGTELYPYHRYGYFVDSTLLYDDIKRNFETFDAYLPSDIYVAVGRTIELYNCAVCKCGNIDDYHFQWAEEHGFVKNLKRKCQIVGNSNIIGNYTLSLNVYNNDLEVVWRGQTNLHIVPVLNNQTPITICPIGDSLTRDKYWLNDIMNNLGENKIEYTGTLCYNPWHILHEGRSGFSAGSYLRATSFSAENAGDYGQPSVNGTIQKFWNPTLERFDWNYYKTTYNINPDVVQIYLGTNGMAIDPTDNATNLKTIVDYIRQDDANIKIIIVLPQQNGTQNALGNMETAEGYARVVGAFELNQDTMVYNFAKKVHELLDSYTNLFVIDLNIMFDRENNYPTETVHVNPHSQTTEIMQTDMVHPTNDVYGYGQHADVMYSVYCGVLS